MADNLGTKIINVFQSRLWRVGFLFSLEDKAAKMHTSVLDWGSCVALKSECQTFQSDTACVVFSEGNMHFPPLILAKAETAQGLPLSEPVDHCSFGSIHVIPPEPMACALTWFAAVDQEFNAI
jgi:hypothetical protein